MNNYDPLRDPIDQMLLQEYKDADGTLVASGTVGQNPEHLKIHKVGPGKAKGALLFKNTSDPNGDKVYTQLHFEPFQWGYIELGTDDATAAAAAKAANATAATAATAAELQNYLNLISSKPFFPFAIQGAAEAAAAIKQYNDSKDVAKFIRVNDDGTEGTDTSAKILAYGVCASEAQLEGKAKFDFKGCDDKEREAERKIASHAIAMAADKGRSVLDKLQVAYKGTDGRDAYLPETTNIVKIGGDSNPLTKLFSETSHSHATSLRPNRYNLHKMIEAPLDAMKSRRRRRHFKKTVKRRRNVRV